MDQSHQHRPASGVKSHRRSSEGRMREYRKAKRRQLLVEQLEPRLLLSGYYTSRAQFLADAQVQNS